MCLPSETYVFVKIETDRIAEISWNYTKFIKTSNLWCLAWTVLFYFLAIELDCLLPFQSIISKSLLEIAQEKCDHAVTADYVDPEELEQHDQERKNQVIIKSYRESLSKK
jgi:hypothetical protein